MGLPIVENLSGPQESIFNLSRGPQLNFVIVVHPCTLCKRQFNVLGVFQFFQVLVAHSDTKDTT